MLKFGFFDSVNGDRKYNAREVSEMFDGIILDGVFMYVGEHFQVDPKEESDMGITVGTGQAWLNHTKILNTRKIAFEIAPSMAADRTDAVIIEVNEKERTGDIFIMEDYEKSKLIDDEWVHQYVIAIITVPIGVLSIGVINIDNRVGVDLPFVKGPNEYLDPDYIMRHWDAIWDTFYKKCVKDWNEFYGEVTENWNNFYDETINTWDEFYNKTLEEVDILLDKANQFTDDAVKAAAAAKESEINAKESEINAKEAAQKVEDMANASESWAVGGIGTREGEDTNNSKFYCERSKEYHDDSAEMLETAQGTMNEILKKIGIADFTIDDEGYLCYSDDSEYNFAVDEDGDLTWEVA